MCKRDCARALAVAGLIVAAAEAQTLLGPFQQFNSWWLHPGQGTAGVRRDPSAIFIDRDGDGAAETSYNIPSIGGQPLAAPNLALSPTRDFLVAFGNSCGSNGWGVYFFDTTAPPNLTLVDTTCIENRISQIAFYDTGLCVWNGIGLDCFEPDGDPLLGVSPQRIAYVADGGNAFTDRVQIYWFDLEAGDHSTTFPGFNRSLELTRRVLVSPNGDVAFVHHDVDGSSTSDYSLVDLCGAERLGDPLSSNVGGAFFNLPGPSIAAAEMILSAGDFFVRVSHPSLSGGSDDAAFNPCGGPPSPTLGACCMGDGSCSQETSGDCAAASGNWLGPNTDCNSCVVLGPCCFTTSCMPDLTQSQCTGLGGAWLGGAGDCSDCELLDLDISMTGPSNALEGETITYTLSYENVGDLSASNVSAADVLPNGVTFVAADHDGSYNASNRTVTWQIGALNPGDSGNRSLQVRVNCGFSSITNSQYSIRSGANVFAGSPPVVTTVNAAGSEPVDIAIASAPDGVPLLRGGHLTHTLSLTNTVATTRQGINFAVFPGWNSDFDAVIDDGGGTVQIIGGVLRWNGPLAPHGAVDVIFTTRVRDCTTNHGEWLNSGNPVSVNNPCGVQLGSASAPGPFEIQQPMAAELFALPPIGPPQSSDFGGINLQVARPGATLDFQLTLANTLPQDQSSVSGSMNIPAELTPIGDPPFIPPTDTGASYDSGTRTISWSGPVPGNGQVQITFRAMLSGGCASELHFSGATGDCNDINPGMRLLSIPEPPALPHLVGITDGVPSGEVWTFRPGIDTSRQTLVCMASEVFFGMGRAPNGDIWVTGLPAFRVNAATLDFEVFPGDSLAVRAFDVIPAADGWVYYVSNRSGPVVILRERPSTGQTETVFDGATTNPPFFSAGRMVMDPDGHLAVIAYSTAAANFRVLRINPADPAAFQAFDASPVQSPYSLALHPDGNYVVSEAAWGSAAIRELVKIDRLTGAVTVLAPNLNDLVPSERPYIASAVGTGGEVYLTAESLVGGGIAAVIQPGPPPNGSVLPCGDGVDMEFVATGGCGFDPCDTNCDGSLNAFDIQPFVDVLSGQGGCSPCAADANGDGSVNGFDIQPFVDCMSG